MPTLTVTLDKINNLRDTDYAGKSDPYVTFELEQDNWVFDKTMGNYTSSKKTNDLSPVFNETFTFEVPSIDNMVLHCQVWDSDIGVDDSLGKVSIKLEDMRLSADPTEVERVVDPKKDKWFSKKARMSLKISYIE
jgi:Ca2+-dependent lipid-binding protein